MYRAHWKIEPQPAVAEQVLDALVEQWQRTPADVVLFPPGTFGDELSTRLAGVYMVQASAGDFVRYSNRKRAQIPLGKCANGDAANRKTPAMPFLARQAGAAKNATLPSGMQQLNIVPCALPDWLVSTEDLKMLPVTH